MVEGDRDLERETELLKGAILSQWSKPTKLATLQNVNIHIL